MTASTGEYLEYRQAKTLDSSKGKFQAAMRHGATAWSCAMVMSAQLAACSQSESKIRALVDDLKQLQRQDPHMHVVVFTQSVRARMSCAAGQPSARVCVSLNLVHERLPLLPPFLCVAVLPWMEL